MAPPVLPDVAAGRLPAETLACNFADAHPPLDPAQVAAESSRCFYCYDAPCIEACPTGIDIPGFIAKLATGNPKGAMNSHRGICNRLACRRIDDTAGNPAGGSGQGTAAR